jgi:hypothetical protein
MDDGLQGLNMGYGHHVLVDVDYEMVQQEIPV